MAKKRFFLGDEWDISHLANLLPKSQYKMQAETIINSWPHTRSYISVHRRNLDGTCHYFARCRKLKKRNRKKCKERDPAANCSVELRLQACDMEYYTIPNPDNMPIVLFTDKQDPEKDSTFPHIFNESTHFLVEMWLMVKSQIHWGNPRSTVDTVVASWRQGYRMEPRACYDPQNIYSNH